MSNLPGWLLPYSNLIALTCALIAPMIAGLVIKLFHLAENWRWSDFARLGLTFFLFMTASAHFINPERMALMLPESVPQKITLIYLTGALEIVLAVTVWIAQLTRLSGAAIAAMLILLLPANVYAAWNSLPCGGNVLGPGYLLVRIPYQIVLVLWALWANGWIGVGTRAR